MALYLRMSGTRGKPSPSGAAESVLLIIQRLITLELGSGILCRVGWWNYWFENKAQTFGTVDPQRLIADSLGVGWSVQR